MEFKRPLEAKLCPDPRPEKIAARATVANRPIVLKNSLASLTWPFSIRPIEVKRFSASAPLASLMFLAGPRFSSG